MFFMKLSALAFVIPYSMLVGMISMASFMSVASGIASTREQIQGGWVETGQAVNISKCAEICPFFPSNYKGNFQSDPELC